MGYQQKEELTPFGAVPLLFWENATDLQLHFFTDYMVILWVKRKNLL